MGLGQDVSFNNDTQDIDSTYGDFSIVSGADNVIQSLIRRLKTVKGSLFYSQNYGSQLHLFIHAPYTSLNASAFKEEIISTVKQEIRINPDRLNVIVGYDKARGFYASLDFSIYTVDEMKILNISLSDEGVLVG